MAKYSDIGMVALVGIMAYAIISKLQGKETQETAKDIAQGTTQGVVGAVTGVGQGIFDSGYQTGLDFRNWLFGSGEKRLIDNSGKVQDEYRGTTNQWLSIGGHRFTTPDKYVFEDTKAILDGSKMPTNYVSSTQYPDAVMYALSKDNNLGRETISRAYVISNPMIMDQIKRKTGAYPNII